MTLHRPTNLMGTASFHEAGERPASPIAAGTRPLTAEERAARRKRHEDEKKLAQMRENPVAFVKEALGVAHVHFGIDMAKPGSDTMAATRVSYDDDGNRKVDLVSLQ